MIKKLTKVGNSKALVLDKTTLEEMGIRDDDRVQVTLSGGSMVVSAVSPRYATDEAFKAASDHVFKKYKGLLRRLA